jgi:hypothetical protein
MTFKVTEKDGNSTFSFNILSEADGIKIWLTDYRLMDGKKTVQRWSHFGDNGTFIKRDKVVIPDHVIESVKLKIASSIYLP